MTGRVLRLQVRDANLRIVAPIGRYGSAEIVPKFNPVSVETCGTFEVADIPRDSDAGEALLQPGAGLVASLDDRRFFSGLVETPQRSRAGAAGARLKVFGYSDDVLAASRDAYPVPATDDLPSQDATSHDVFTGNAGDAIRYYLNRNMSAAARPSVRVPTFTAPAGDPVGTNVIGRSRFRNLAELVSALALAGEGIGWRILDENGVLVGRPYAPRDRSRHARFSAQLRNLNDYEFATPKARVTRAVVAGGGQGVNRRFAGHAVTAAWHDVRTTFVDRRDAGGGTDQTLTPEEIAAIVADLEQSAREAVEQGRPAASFSATVVDTPSVGFLRPDHLGGYGMGDKVTVSVEGQKLVDVVRQVSVQTTTAGVQVRTTVGAPDAQNPTIGPLAGLIQRLVRAERALDQLKRSQ